MSPTATATRDRSHLSVVPDPEPAKPATPCPPWCELIGTHDPADRFHYSPTVQVGRIGSWVSLDEDNTATVKLDVKGIVVELDLDSLDQLIAVLPEHRAVLAELAAGGLRGAA